MKGGAENKVAVPETLVPGPADNASELPAEQPASDTRWLHRLHDHFRAWCRKVWHTRGGGLYAVGFAIAFLYFEVTDVLMDDIPTLFQLNLFSGEVVDSS